VEILQWSIMIAAAIVYSAGRKWLNRQNNRLLVIVSKNTGAMSWHLLPGLWLLSLYLPPNCSRTCRWISFSNKWDNKERSYWGKNKYRIIGSSIRLVWMPYFPK
jgi:hypothetical protein